MRFFVLDRMRSSKLLELHHTACKIYRIVYRRLKVTIQKFLIYNVRNCSSSSSTNKTTVKREIRAHTFIFLFLYFSTSKIKEISPHVHPVLYVDVIQIIHLPLLKGRTHSIPPKAFSHCCHSKNF